MEIHFVKTGNVNLVKLIKNVNKKVSESGNTLLHKAVQYKQKEIVRTLLDKGANVYAKNNKGEYPIYYLNDRDITEMILNAGFDINQRNDKKQTLLHLATGSSLLEYIIEKNPRNLNVDDQDGNMPIHQAVLHNNLENVKILVKHKPLIVVRNKENQTPLELAVYAHEKYGHNNADIIAFLTQAQIDNKVYLPLEQGEECAICLEEMGLSEPNCVVRSIDPVKYSCGHTFHCKCIIKWNREEGKKTCPLCRAPMDIIQRFYIKKGETGFGKRSKRSLLFQNGALQRVNSEIKYLNK
jgi:hypothetical protein